MSFTVHHPRIAGVKVEGLSAAGRDAHKKAGWVSSSPTKAVKSTPSRKTSKRPEPTRVEKADEPAE